MGFERNSDGTFGLVDRPVERGCVMLITLKPTVLPFAEELEVEGDDGVVRAGVFIPYEENCFTRSGRNSFCNFIAYPSIGPGRKPYSAAESDSHYIYPYWRESHIAGMRDIGIQRPYCGWAKIISQRQYRDDRKVFDPKEFDPSMFRTMR